MTLTLVCDHRILYGADAAQFLGAHARAAGGAGGADAVSDPSAARPAMGACERR